MQVCSESSDVEHGCPSGSAEHDSQLECHHDSFRGLLQQVSQTLAPSESCTQQGHADHVRQDCSWIAASPLCMWLYLHLHGALSPCFTCGKAGQQHMQTEGEMMQQQGTQFWIWMHITHMPASSSCLATVCCLEQTQPLLSLAHAS